MIISPMDIALDEQNPRFQLAIDTSNQQSIREYLQEHEDVIELANQINENHGLLLGERVVVCQENGQTIVVEGNRRVCACQLLLDRSYILPKYIKRISEANPKTLPNIMQIDADVTDRETALRIMATRHIAGVKRWSPIAKKTFFSKLFEKNRNINIIAEKTSSSASEVKDDIQDIKLLTTAINLPCWNAVEKSILRLDKYPPLDIDRFLRLFHTQGMKKTFMLSFDNQTQEPISSLPGGLFEYVLEFMMRGAFIETDKTKQIDTRSSFKDPVFAPLKERLATPIIPPVLATPPEDKPPTHSNNGFSGIPNPPMQKQNSGESDNPQPKEDPLFLNLPPDGLNALLGLFKPPVEEPKFETPPEIPPQNPPNNPVEVKRPKPGGLPSDDFFENLSYRSLDKNNDDQKALHIICEQLRKISITKLNDGTLAYKAFPIATASLLRSAYEQAIVLQCIKRKVFTSSVQSINLSELERRIFSNEGIKTDLFPEKKGYDAFDHLFSQNARKILNNSIHHPNWIQADESLLRSLASTGLRALLEYVIESPYKP